MTVSLQQYKDLLSRYLGPQWVRVGLLAVVLVGTTLLQLANPQIVRFFIDTAIAGGALDSLIGAAILFLGIALVTQLLRIAGRGNSSLSITWKTLRELPAKCPYLKKNR